jgi:hypothetical protein
MGKKKKGNDDFENDFNQLDEEGNLVEADNEEPIGETWRACTLSYPSVPFNSAPRSQQRS